MNVEKIVEQTLLFDFYGELLTEHQRQIYEDVVFNDLSLSEVAEERGISRQGVHDMIRRCTKTLEGYEEKLGLVHRFLDLKAKAEKIRSITEDSRVKELAEEILEEL